MADGRTPEDDERSEKLIAALEARMRQSETFTWNVPALVIAAQAFLFTVGLSPTASHREKAVAAAAGVTIVLAALHFLWKHSFNFDVLEAVIERENDALGRHRVAIRQLLESLKENPPPKCTNFPMLWEGPWWRKGWRTLLVRNARAVWVWTVAFGVLLALDIWILARAV